VPDALLVLHIDIEIAEQDDATIGADALAATREFPALPFMMFTPSFWSKDTPDTSSKQTTSFTQALWRRRV
jgi:hypothetical protein